MYLDAQTSCMILCQWNKPKFDFDDQIHGVGMREACNRPTTLLSLFYDHTSAVIMTCYKLSMPSGKSYNMWRFRRSMYVHHKLSQLYCWTVITDHSGTAIYRSPLMHTHATIFYVQLQNITRLRILQKTRTQSFRMKKCAPMPDNVGGG